MSALPTHSPVSPSVPSAQAVTFSVGDLRLGLDVACVREIVRGAAPVRVPHAPADVAGIIDWRGRLIPLIDLRARFGVAGSGTPEHARVIIVETGSRTFGLAVDSVHTIMRIDPGTLDAPGQPRSALPLAGVRAVANDDLILLDPASLATGPSGN